MSAAASQVQIHSTHIVLFAVWVAVFTAVYVHKRARTSRPEATPGRATQPTLRVRILGLPGAIALCSIIAAAVHLSVIDDHFHEAVLYGTFFLLLTAGQFAFAAWILWRPSRALFLAGAAASLAIVLLWLATRTTGIPLGPAAGETEPVGRLDLTASAAELAITLLCIAALRAWQAAPRRASALPRVRTLAREFHLHKRGKADLQRD